MDEHNHPEDDVAKDRARAGSTPHIARYVLVISTLLAIALLSIVWISRTY